MGCRRSGLAKFGFCRLEILAAEERGAQIVMGQRRIRIQLDRHSQFADRLRLLVDQMQGLSQIAVLVRTDRDSAK